MELIHLDKTEHIRAENILAENIWEQNISSGNIWAGEWGLQRVELVGKTVLKDKTGNADNIGGS